MFYTFEYLYTHIYDLIVMAGNHYMDVWYNIAT